MEAASYFFRRDRLDLGLRHLPDLLRQAHAGENFFDPRFDDGIGLDRAVDLRPVGQFSRRGRL